MKLKKLRQMFGSRAGVLVLGSLVLVGGGYWVYDNYLALEFGRSSAAGGVLCTASQPVVAPNVAVTFTATGGATPSPRLGVAGAPNTKPLPTATPTPQYTWNAKSGVPPTGTGATFTTSFPKIGKYTVSVALGRQKGGCVITVAIPSPTPPPPTRLPKPTCSPRSQSTVVERVVTLTATGPGPHAWSAPGGEPSSANQNLLRNWPTFQTMFRTPGNYYVAVTNSGQLSDYCEVQVEPYTTPTATPTPTPTSTPTQFHLVCINNACESVVGAGANECNVDWQCQ